MGQRNFLRAQTGSPAKTFQAGCSLSLIEAGYVCSLTRLRLNSGISLTIALGPSVRSFLLTSHA
jgi:hypothetical protein